MFSFVKDTCKFLTLTFDRYIFAVCFAKTKLQTALRIRSLTAVHDVESSQQHLESEIYISLQSWPGDPAPATHLGKKSTSL